MNLERAATEFRRYTKEKIDVQDICGTIYAFGSELACLRLFYTYHHCGEKANAGYSENRKTWYFRLEK